MRRATFPGLPGKSLRRRTASGWSGVLPRARVCLSKLGDRPRINRLRYDTVMGFLPVLDPYGVYQIGDV